MAYLVSMQAMEVERALVALPDFKSGVPGEKPGRWVRFPCTSATSPRPYRAKAVCHSTLSPPRQSFSACPSTPCPTIAVPARCPLFLCSSGLAATKKAGSHRPCLVVPLNGHRARSPANLRRAAGGPWLRAAGHSAAPPGGRCCGCGRCSGSVRQR